MLIPCGRKVFYLMVTEIAKITQRMNVSTGDWRKKHDSENMKVLVGKKKKTQRKKEEGVPRPTLLTTNLTRPGHGLTTTSAEHTLSCYFHFHFY